jgi:two-component system CheB/CheR fusion protein
MRRNAAQASALGSGVLAESVLEHLPLGLLLLGADRRVLRTNPRYCAIASTSADETVGKGFFEVSGGLWDVPAVRALVEAADAGEAGRIDVDLIGKDRPRSMRVHAQPLASPGAGPEHLLVVVDPLEGGEAETDREEGDARDELIARAAHELRGPLGSISNWVHLLSQGRQDGALQQQGLAAISRALGVATRIIETLNDVAQLGAGRVSLRLGLVDLSSVVDMALERPRSAAREKGVRLDFLRDVPSVPVMGDPDRLQQIVLHLLGNAVECTPPGGRVEISVGREGPSWLLAVKDTGRGIAPDVLSRIFGGLRSTDFTSPRPPATLGAGLTIVRFLAELHGGSVEASSAGPGRGARFAVRLPVPALAPSGQPAGSAATSEPVAGRPRPPLRGAAGPTGRKPATNPNA